MRGIQMRDKIFPLIYRLENFEKSDKIEAMTLKNDNSVQIWFPILMSSSQGSDDGNETERGVITQTKPKTKKPSLYKVLVLNDDFTPMEFVVHILQRFFNKNSEEATQIMLHVHQSGVGICGVYTFEIAETKVTQVMDLARQHQHPLQCTMEKD